MQYMYFFECITCKSQKNAKARRKISLAKGWGWGKSSFDDVQYYRKYVAKSAVEISGAVWSVLYQLLIVVLVVALLWGVVVVFM